MKAKNLVVVALAALIGIGTSIATVPSAQALGTPKTQQVVTWGWEDGADKSHRDFAEDDYDTAADLPTLQVRITPTTVGRRVVLEAFDEFNSTWSQVQASQTSAAGVAVLKVDPACDDSGAWCDHDQTYRIRVLRSGTQKLQVTRPFMISFTASIPETI
jgi:hypothetical protein